MKRLFKRGGAGVLALVLVCVMAITSYSPVTTYADDDQGHFDTTAPVIDDVVTDGVKESYEQNEALQLKVHTYDDGGSHLHYIYFHFDGVNVDDEKQIDSESRSFDFTHDSDDMAYDEASGYYTFSISADVFKPGYKYTLTSIQVYDGVDNNSYAPDEKIKDKVSFTVADKKNDVVKLASLDITDDNGNSVIGQTVDNNLYNFAATLSDCENIKYVVFEFKHLVDSGSYTNQTVYCYKQDETDKFTADSPVSQYGFYDKVVENKLVKAYVVKDDGTKESLDLSNGFDNISVFTNPQKSENIKNKYTVESIKFSKEDGTEIKSGDILEREAKINVTVKANGVDGRLETYNSVSYTHLTLPTICSV